MRVVKAEALAFLALLCVATAANAGWREDASPFDARRLDQIDEARSKAITLAHAGGKAADLAAIDSILYARPVTATARALTGDWHCRIMKLGGLTPEIVYTWFRCRIGEQNGKLTFEKLSGSSRAFGTLYPAGKSFVYLGASYVGTGYGRPEKRPVYSGTGAAAGAPATPDDQIGLLSLLADGRARLEMPYPVQESVFDVIELKR